PFTPHVSFEGMPRAEQLVLTDTGISELEGLRGFSEVNLMRSPVSNLEGLETVTLLALSQAKLRPGFSFRDAKSLEILMLQGMDLAHVQISHLPALRMLSLNNSSGIDPNNLRDLDGLQILVLDGTDIHHLSGVETFP